MKFPCRLVVESGKNLAHPMGWARILSGVETGLHNPFSDFQSNEELNRKGDDESNSLNSRVMQGGKHFLHGSHLLALSSNDVLFDLVVN